METLLVYRTTSGCIGVKLRFAWRPEADEQAPIENAHTSTQVNWFEPATDQPLCQLLYILFDNALLRKITIAIPFHMHQRLLQGYAAANLALSCLKYADIPHRPVRSHPPEKQLLSSSNLPHLNTKDM
jgi:hypothetical protein